MASWVFNGELDSNCKAGKLFGKALLEATVYGKEICKRSDDFVVYWENGGSNDTSYEPGISWSGDDVYVYVESLETFLLEATKSIVALYPECRCSSWYYGSFSISGNYYGKIIAENGVQAMETLSDEDDSFDDIEEQYFQKYLKEMLGDDYDEDQIDEYDDEYWEDWHSDEWDPNDHLLESKDRGTYTPYSKLKLNWTGEGTCGVIRAAIDSDNLDRVEAAIKNGYITRRMLDEARKTDTAAVDEEVKTFLKKQISQL